MSGISLTMLGRAATITVPDGGSPASFYHDTIAVSDGSANAFIYRPSNIENPPTGGWPLIIFFGGDGTSGNTTRTFTSVSMSTSDDFTYTNSPTPALFRIVTTTIVIKVNGTPIAYGEQGGAITGAGVTGTITGFDQDAANSNTSPTISVTFSSSQSGNTITFDYVDTTVVAEGPFRWANLGDTFDNRAVVMTLQNIQSTSDFDLDYFDHAVEYACSNFTINPNRISPCGISRGGRCVLDSPGVLWNRYQFWIDDTTSEVLTSAGAGRTESGIASLVTGTASYGGTHTASNYTEIGMANVHGNPDFTLSNGTPGWASVMGGNNEPPFILNIQGAGHEDDVWDGKCYKRLYRVGPATGSLTTAPWDWVDFLLKYSRNALERATLFVEQVEKRRYNTEKDIIDYRHALRQTNTLGSSSEKTALLGRLASVKSDIDDGGTRWVINFHNTGDGESGGYANFTGTSSGSLVSNIADFDGNSSTVDIELDVSTGLAMETIGSSRRTHTGGFSKTANNSGLLLNSSPIGRLLLTGLPSGTYTIRLYHNKGDANFSTNPNTYIDIDSVVQQGYAVVNTMLGYIEYAGLSETEVADIDIAKTAGGNPVLTMIELFKE